MPRVLVATDEPNFSLGLVEGYQSLGWEVAMGTLNFRIRAAEYDVVHHQWPEEFSGWGAPDLQERGEIESHLRWWQSRATNIFTVNNLYPHQYERDSACHALYSSFFKHCQLITHYTEASRRLVLEEYPAARNIPHIVHSPATYAVTLKRQTQRGSRRSQLGIQEDEFVILILGSLRSWDEVALLQKAYALARIPKKRLLMAGKCKFKGPPWKKRIKMFLFGVWLKSRHAVVDNRYVPEEEVSQFIDSCDVAVVPRSTGLNSAIIFLSMTFGRAVVAPNFGGYADCLAGTRNLLYETGSAEDLAAKLEQAASLDLKDIGRENAGIASYWTWKRMCETCLAAAKIA